ncbi:two-component system sensor histidine kinase RegB [Sphingomonas sp. BE138]|uniref:ATP-binding protein n=1 Tax=Sphingomonas sp. BE138 TaxID=2817845 RepID=UPI002854CA91|nr:ATP-binding protein [Sphingomonas sp. BE138]MDR6788323.1 two-component system sensor histidine kinase RegB [Sphingomonas sp. BE138]
MPASDIIAGTGLREDAGRRNVRLLSILRWLAVGGQLAAIALVHFVVGVRLPLVPMLGAVAVLVALNLAIGQLVGRRPITYGALFATLLVDVACLTTQLYLSGGVGNPFVTLFLLQVVIAALLLRDHASWAMVALTSALFAWLAHAAPPFALPPGWASSLSTPYVAGSWFNFTLTATLLALFVTRIVRNVSEHDARLAALRQRAAEEEHIVRMGLLASGAAHELGTPLSSIAVMLGDWRREPAIAASPALLADLEDMRTEVTRCKDILSQVLLASGEVRGIAPVRTTLRTFLAGIVGDWRGKTGVAAAYEHLMTGDPRIVADKALAQTITNLLDNALEAGGRTIALCAWWDGDRLVLSVRDDGRGFAPAILDGLGKPYLSTKARRGAGLGLFLAVNVLRTLGGAVSARNREGGGGEVTLTLPIAAIAVPEEGA